MKKAVFPLLFCLCVLLLAGCMEGEASCPAAPAGYGSVAASLSSAADSAEADGSGMRFADEPRAEKIPMVMLDGELYCDTGAVSDHPRCGMMDGQISSSVESWQRPAEDGQSNFGSGYGYQTAPGGTIEINIDGQWRVFRLRSEMRVRYCGGWFDAADISDETLRWLLWFNSLSEDDQMRISYVPLDLYELCGHSGADDTAAEDAAG